LFFCTYTWQPTNPPRRLVAAPVLLCLLPVAGGRGAETVRKAPWVPTILGPPRHTKRGHKGERAVGALGGWP